MNSIKKHISFVVLLLFVIAMSGRTASAFEAWRCASSSAQSEHHECCSCHCESFDYHAKSLADNCSSHAAEETLGEATLSSESKQNPIKRFFILIAAVCLLTLVGVSYTLPSRDYGEQGRVDYVQEWICNVGLLRAPPVC